MNSNYKISPAKLIILFLIASLSFVSCNKDNDHLVEKVNKLALNSPINLEDAKVYYQKNIKSDNENVSESFDGNFDSFTDLEPLWNLSSKVYNNAGNELLLVPVAYNSGISDPTIGVQYVFFNSAACGGLTCEIIFYKPEYIPGLNNIERTSSFTGAVTTFSFCSCQFNAFIGKEGEFYFLESKDSLDEGVSNNTTSIQSRDSGGPKCYNFNGTFWSRLGNWFVRAGYKFVDFFDSGGGSAGSGGSPTSYPVFFSSSGFPGYSGNGDAGESGGGSVIINGFDLGNYLENSFFRGFDGNILWSLNEIISNNNLFICVNDAHEEIFTCLQQNSGNLNMGCPVSDQTGVLNASCYSQMLSMLDPSHTCLSQLLGNYQVSTPSIEFGDGELICAIEEANNTSLSNNDLFSIIKDKCSYDFQCRSLVLEWVSILDQVGEEYNIEFDSGFIIYTLDQIDQSTSTLDNDHKVNLILTHYAEYLHDSFISNSELFPDYNIDLNQIISQHGAEKYIGAALIYEHYVLEVGVAPTDPYQWRLMMEVFVEELGPTLLELIPGGIGDLIAAYNSFNEGNYFMGALNIILAIVPGSEVFKVIKKGDKINDGWKVVKSVKNVFNNIWHAGGQKIFNNLPNNWKNSTTKKFFVTPDGKNKGFHLSNPNKSDHHLRVMQGDPESIYPHSRNPYVRMHRNNSYYDKYGNTVLESDPLFNEKTHIPLYELSENSIINFFNL